MVSCASQQRSSVPSRTVFCPRKGLSPAKSSFSSRLSAAVLLLSVLLLSVHCLLRHQYFPRPRREHRNSLFPGLSPPPPRAKVAPDSQCCCFLHCHMVRPSAHRTPCFGRFLLCTAYSALVPCPYPHTCGTHALARCGGITDGFVRCGAIKMPKINLAPPLGNPQCPTEIRSTRGTEGTAGQWQCTGDNNNRASLGEQVHESVELVWLCAAAWGTSGRSHTSTCTRRPNLDTSTKSGEKVHRRIQDNLLQLNLRESLVRWITLNANLCENANVVR